MLAQTNYLSLSILSYRAERRLLQRSIWRALLRVVRRIPGVGYVGAALVTVLSMVSGMTGVFLGSGKASSLIDLWGDDLEYRTVFEVSNAGAVLHYAGSPFHDQAAYADRWIPNTAFYDSHNSKDFPIIYTEFFY